MKKHNNTKLILREYFSTIGKRGGSAGTGLSKIRGDKEYYARLSKKAAAARKRIASGK